MIVLALAIQLPRRCAGDTMGDPLGWFAIGLFEQVAVRQCTDLNLHVDAIE